MLKIIGRELGEMVARKMLEMKEVENSLEGLNELLKFFFDEVEKIVPEKHSVDIDFTSSLHGDVLITSSRCPVHKFYSKWCEEGCLEFIKSFAKTFNDKLEVERVEKQPESRFCKFKFTF